MSTPEHQHGPEPAALRCPRCGAAVAPEQDWCVECGAPARTRLAPTPNWKLPVAVIALVVALAGIALAVAFNQLTRDVGVVTATTPAAAPAQPNETATATVPAPPPVTATAPATTTPPTTSMPSSTPTSPTTPTTPGA